MKISHFALTEKGHNEIIVFASSVVDIRLAQGLMQSISTSHGLNNGFSDPRRVLASFQCNLRNSSFHNVHEGRVLVCPTYIDIVMSKNSVPVHIHDNRVSQLKVSKVIMPNFSGLPLRRFIYQQQEKLLKENRAFQ